MSKLLAATLLALCSVTHAEFVSGEHLYNAFNSTDPSERSVAAGYVVGVTDTVTGTHVCLPASTAVKQVVGLVYQWLEHNPQYRHNSGDRVVVAVLAQAWPCVKGKQSDV